MNFPVRAINAEVFLEEQQAHLDTIVLDVRTTLEADRDTLPLKTLHLDFLESGFELAIENLDRFRPYILICDTGKRSRMACELMASKGFALVSWLEGGKPTLDKLLYS